MKHTLYGLPEQPVDSARSAALAEAIWETDLLSRLIINLRDFEFEVRAVAAPAFTGSCRDKPAQLGAQSHSDVNLRMLPPG
jgi:hypothetical protein